MNEPVTVDTLYQTFDEDGFWRNGHKYDVAVSVVNDTMEHIAGLKALYGLSAKSFVFPIPSVGFGQNLVRDFYSSLTGADMGLPQFHIDTLNLDEDLYLVICWYIADLNN